MESTRRHPNVINVDEVPPQTLEKGARFKAETRRLGIPTGSRGIGCGHIVVPPGKTAFPFHAHHVNDEALYILAGRGTLRIGDAKVTVRPGDFIAHPAGGDAHQLVADGDGPLEYLALSTSDPADIVVYPDSNKIAAMSRKRPPPTAPEVVLREIHRRGAAVDYYDGEESG